MRLHVACVAHVVCVSICMWFVCVWMQACGMSICMWCVVCLCACMWCIHLSTCHSSLHKITLGEYKTNWRTDPVCWLEDSYYDSFCYTSLWTDWFFSSFFHIHENKLINNNKTIKILLSRPVQPWANTFFPVLALCSKSIILAALLLKSELLPSQVWSVGRKQYVVRHCMFCLKIISSSQSTEITPQPGPVLSSSRTLRTAQTHRVPSQDPSAKGLRLPSDQHAFKMLLLWGPTKRFSSISETLCSIISILVLPSLVSLLWCRLSEVNLKRQS